MNWVGWSSRREEVGRLNTPLSDRAGYTGYQHTAQRLWRSSVAVFNPAMMIMPGVGAWPAMGGMSAGWEGGVSINPESLPVTMMPFMPQLAQSGQ